MRSAILTVTLLLATAGTAIGGDYIRLAVDSIPAGWPEVEIPFFAERTCPYPGMIMGTSNGFVLHATGDVTWEYAGYAADPTVCGWFMLSFLFTNGFDDISPDSFLTGGASMPPGGMPVFEDRPMFTIWLNVGDAEGEICIDSAFVFAAGAWKWSSMQCGLGGAPDRPLFIDKYGSDENHPICIPVCDMGPPPEPPVYDDWVRIGVDSLAAGTIRAELPFYISRTCPVGSELSQISTGFEITPTGYVTWSFSDYEVGPVLHDWFDWAIGELDNRIDGISPDSFHVVSWRLWEGGLPVTTEELYFTLYLDIGPNTGELCVDSSFIPTHSAWQFAGLTCGQGGDPERPLFLAKDSSNANHPVCITIYESACGDVKADGTVDIDDIVQLLQYVFGVDPVTITVGKADVDCSGAVDVDDIVYLLDYVFGTGPEPCAACP